MEPAGSGRTHTKVAAATELSGASEWNQREAVRHRRSNAEVADRELGNSSQSIEAQAKACTRVSNTHVIYRTFPAGIRPAGAEADRRESARALMSGVANQSMEPMGIARHKRARKSKEPQRGFA